MRRFEEEVARTKHSKVMRRVVRRERVSSVGGGGGGPGWRNYRSRALLFQFLYPLHVSMHT